MEKLPDHEMFAISLETLLSTHFMYGDVDFQKNCVPSARTSILLGETADDLRKQKKFSGYVVYVAYRLEPKSMVSHSMKLSKVSRVHSLFFKYLQFSMVNKNHFWDAGS